jgi:hypothetical protein
LCESLENLSVGVYKGSEREGRKADAGWRVREGGPGALGMTFRRDAAVAWSRLVSFAVTVKAYGAV